MPRHSETDIFVTDWHQISGHECTAEITILLYMLCRLCHLTEWRFYDFGGNSVSRLHVFSPHTWSHNPSIIIISLNNIGYILYDVCVRTSWTKVRKRPAKILITYMEVSNGAYLALNLSNIDGQW